MSPLRHSRMHEEQWLTDEEQRLLDERNSKPSLPKLQLPCSSLSSEQKQKL